MAIKTQVIAPTGQQELFITRDFDIPVHLLYQAYTDPEIVAQWMGTKVLKLENRPHGSWQFETSDPSGNVVFRANGVIHEIIPDQKITRTFKMENTPFEVQLEFLDFIILTPETSQLRMQIVFRTLALRDQLMKLPFAQGLNMAHNRLQEIFKPTHH